MGAFLEYVLDAIFFFAILRIVYLALRQFFAPRSAPASARRSPDPRASPVPPAGEMVRDPECGMFVSTELSRRLPWKGEVLHFCSQECMEKYQSRARAS